MSVEIHSFTPAVPQEADDGNQHPVLYRQSQEKCVSLLQIRSSLNCVWLAYPFVTHHLDKILCCQKWELGREMTLTPRKIAMGSKGQHWKTLPNNKPSMNVLWLPLFSPIKFILITSMRQRNFLLQQALDMEHCNQRQYRELDRPVICSRVAPWFCYQNPFN